VICILKIEGGEVKGWILAADIQEARMKAQGTMDRGLVQALDRIEVPPKGKTVLPNGCLLLVK
jgi:hypothetical protein